MYKIVETHNYYLKFQNWKNILERNNKQQGLNDINPFKR